MPEWLNLLGIVLGLAGAGGLTLAWAKGAYRRSSAAVWRETAEAEKARREQLECEVAGLREDVAKLHNKVAVLTEMVTGQHAIESLGDLIDSRFDKLEGMIARG